MSTHASSILYTYINTEVYSTHIYMYMYAHNIHKYTTQKGNTYKQTCCKCREYVCINLLAPVCIYLFMQFDIYIYMYTCTYTHAYIFICVHIYVYVPLYSAYTYVYICTYLHYMLQEMAPVILKSFHFMASRRTNNFW